MTNQAINLEQAIALGKNYIEQGNIEEAKELYEMVLTHLPKNKAVKEGLKRIKKLTSKKGYSVLSPTQIENVIRLHSSGKSKEALIAAENLYRKFPKNPKVYNLLGGVQQKLGKFTDAIASFKQALLIKPDFAEAYFNLGITLIKLSKHNEAITSFRRALDIKPDFFDAKISLAKALTELGICDESVLVYQQALAIKSGHTETHRSLSRLKKYSINDDHINQMEALLADVKVDADKIQLCFALTKAYEDTGEINKSFSAAKNGNDLCKKEFKYSLESDSLNFSKLKKIMSDKVPVYKASSHHSLQSIKPVFIVGMPRSGTSIVEQIIASHSKVYGAGELNAMGNAVYNVLLKGDFNQNKTPDFEQIKNIRNQYL